MSRKLNTIPPELILLLQPHLGPVDHLSLVLASRFLYYTLGPVSLTCHETLMLRKRLARDSLGYLKTCGSCGKLRSFWNFPNDNTFGVEREGIFICLDCWGTAGPRHIGWLFGLTLATTKQECEKGVKTVICGDKKGCGASRWGKLCVNDEKAVWAKPAAEIRERLDDFEKVLPRRWRQARQEEWKEKDWKTVEDELVEAVKAMGLDIPNTKSHLMIDAGSAKLKERRAPKTRAPSFFWMAIPLDRFEKDSPAARGARRVLPHRY